MKKPIKQNPAGRLDIAVFRMFEHAANSNRLTKALWDNGGKEWAEFFCADQLPGHNVLGGAPKPKRRLA